MFEDQPFWRRAALPGLSVLAVLYGIYVAGGAGRAADEPQPGAATAQVAHAAALPGR